MGLKLAVVSACTLLFALARCDDELSASENARLAGECSTGPAPYDDTHPLPRRSPVPYKDEPTCAARCGTQPLRTPVFGTSWAYDALPSGACTTGTHCQIPASTTQTCGTDTHACNLSEVQCECADGQWRCYLVAQGAGACLPCDFDAGVH